MQAPQTRSTACFICGQEGHRAAGCKTNCLTKKMKPISTGKATKNYHRLEKLLKGVEVVEFTLSPKWPEGTPTPPTDGQELTDTDSDDDPLVSGPITPVTIPIELSFQALGLKANLRGPLDSGCTRCLVN